MLQACNDGKLTLEKQNYKQTLIAKGLEPTQKAMSWVKY